ncbi:MAG: FAD binding domain-containing protein [Desulfurococcaceae archaeon TW002]
MFRFDLYVPRDLRDALEALRIYGEEMLPIGGGTDLLVLYRQGLVKFKVLLDLWPLRNGLSYVKLEGGLVKIGALTTIDELESSELLKDKRFAGLKDACRSFASPFIRSLATVGGNVGVAHPLSDIAITLLTYDASVKLKSLEGERVIPLKNFYMDKRKTAKKPEELITEVFFSEPPSNASSVFAKLDRRVGHGMGYVAVGVYAELDNRLIREVRIAFDSMGRAFPERALGTEESLRGRELSEENIDRAVYEVLPKEMRRISDYRASAEYRIHLSQVLLKRALLEVGRRIRGE